MARDCDLTVNARYLDPRIDTFHDPLDARTDLAQGSLRTVAPDTSRPRGFPSRDTPGATPGQATMACARDAGHPMPARTPAGPRPRRTDATLTREERVRLRAAVNEWISQTFPRHRRLLSHAQGKYCPRHDAWTITLETKPADATPTALATLLVDHDGRLLHTPDPRPIMTALDTVPPRPARRRRRPGRAHGPGWEFREGDGIAGAHLLRDTEVDLLLTDPPYGISKTRTCERQIPRRLRKTGHDFVMPKGDFGPWDRPVDPASWLDPLLAKVGGWIVTFCAQAQIGEYTQYLEKQRFVAVGTLVWQKTNPVPFNHRHKPVNAWEAAVCAKRPRTPFNGKTVHNVFVHSSPGPRDRVHPTQKPVALIEEWIRLFSREGGLVYDPFGGGGTTVLAARAQGRKVLSFEADPDIFDAARRRLERHL